MLASFGLSEQRLLDDDGPGREPLRHAIRRFALIGAALDILAVSLVTGVCLWGGWTSLHDVSGALVVAGVVVIVVSGLPQLLVRGGMSIPFDRGARGGYQQLEMLMLAEESMRVAMDDRLRSPHEWMPSAFVGLAAGALLVASGLLLPVLG